MDETGAVEGLGTTEPPIPAADALAAVIASDQAQINAAVTSADAAVRAAMDAVAQAEKSMTAAIDQLPTADPILGGPASLQQTVESTLKLQQGAVDAAIRQAQAAVAAAVASTEATLRKLP
jgi:hypothetical protein